MKKLFSILIGTALVAAVIIACKDNFNESDFLKLQSQLKTQQDSAKLNQQLKQLNDAGELLSFTVQVVEDRTPLADVDVQISNDVTSGTAKVTTDANGNAIFTKVRVGSNTVILSKSGYITTTAVVDFGSLTNFYTTVTGANGSINVVALKQSRSCILPLFSIGGTGSTATITGKVTIENDLTNTTPEIPQNITLKANYASGLTTAVPGTGVTINSYSFNNGGIGTATVDNTTGNYTMIVPALAAGLSMSLIVPEIEGNLKLAANTVDGQPANGQPAPQIFPAAMLSMPTQWGNLVAGYDVTIPTVVGAKAVFPAPPPAGAGLSFTMSALARPLGVAADGVTPSTWDTYNFGIDPGDPTQFDVAQTAYQLTTRGSGYTASPTVTVTGGGGSNAVMKASLRGYLTGLTINAGGTGYDGSNITVTFSYVDNNSVTYDMIFPSCAVTVSAGALATITLPTFSSPWQTVVANSVAGYNVASFKATISGGAGTGATVTPVFSAEVDHIKLEKAGTGFNAAPTITFTGGGGTTQATMAVKEFRTQWSVAPNNTTNTTPYSILPDNITWQYNQLNGGIFTENRVYDKENNISFYNDDIQASDGQVIHLDPTKTFRTFSFNQVQPVPIITSSPSTQAQANLNINSNGQIPSIFSTNNGRGYSTPPTVTIQPMVTGAPGSGAVIDLSGSIGYNSKTGEYSWGGGSTVLTTGTGYAQFVNKQPYVPYAGPASTFTVKTGETTVQNIVYGTGKRKQQVN
ncbi:MAG: carboxypeptidase regulatory-like domain-containing protein [Bacteroidetes bacterium]|nr:carboxypeptidase regulatory-like domain-containing protein [Bacteroidota bacterium]